MPSSRKAEAAKGCGFGNTFFSSLLPGAKSTGWDGGQQRGHIGASLSLGLQLPGCHYRDHSLAGGLSLWARPSARQIANTLPFHPCYIPILQTVALRARAGEVPPTLSSSKPRPQPLCHGWLPHPGAPHFDPLLKSCSIQGGPFCGALTTSTVRESPCMSSLRPLRCFSTMSLALELECKGTLSPSLQQCPWTPLASTEHLQQEAFHVSFAPAHEGLS